MDTPRATIRHQAPINHGRTMWSFPSPPPSASRSSHPTMPPSYVPATHSVLSGFAWGGPCGCRMGGGIGLGVVSCRSTAAVVRWFGWWWWLAEEQQRLSLCVWVWNLNFIRFDRFDQKKQSKPSPYIYSDALELRAAPLLLINKPRNPRPAHQKQASPNRRFRSR